MNESSSPVPFYCNASTAFVHAIGTNVLMILEIVVGSASVFGNGLLIGAVWSVSLFQANLRWLLINLSVNLLWYAAATVIKSMYFLSMALFVDPCSLTVVSSTCKMWEMIFITPFLNTTYSLMAVGLERLISTLRYRTYDNSKFPWIACLFIPAIWIGTLSNQLAVLANLPAQYLPICMSYLFTPLSVVQTTLATNTALEIIALTLISLLYMWNVQKQNRAVNITYVRRGYSLASRFQIIQNVNVNKFLLPSIIAHACAHLPYNIFLMFLLLKFQLSLETKVLLVHLTYIWVVGYGTTHAWIAFYRHPQLKAKFEMWAPRLVLKMIKNRQGRKIENYNPSAVADAHFDMLGKLWAMKAPQMAAITQV